MAELTVRDGWPPPDDLPRGDVIITSLENGGIRIDHADPRVLISADLLASVATAPGPHAALDTSGCRDCFMQDDYTNAVLKIQDASRQLVYRITEYVPAVHGYIAEWPD